MCFVWHTATLFSLQIIISRSLLLFVGAVFDERVYQLGPDKAVGPEAGRLPG